MLPRPILSVDQLSHDLWSDASPCPTVHFQYAKRRGQAVKNWTMGRPGNEASLMHDRKVL